MSAKPTAGPWSVGGKYAHPTVLVNGRGESIASGGNNRAVVGEELAASLELAAEAGTILHETGLTPRELAAQRAELVAALERAEEALRHAKLNANAILARAALAKVRGGAK